MFTVLSLFIFYSHFFSIPLVFPLPIFSSSCRPFISSSADVELRYKVKDACLSGTSLLIVFLSLPPPHSLFFLPTSRSASPFPQPPEYIKTLYLFYLYVNAPSHSSPFLLSLSAIQKVPPFALGFLSLQLISPGR